jgi:hypothetical protein
MNIEKIKPTIATSIITRLSVFFLVILSFFLLARNLFITLDIPRLIGVAIGISLPIIFFNVFIYFGFIYGRKDDKDKEDQEVYGISAGGSIAIFVFVPCLLLSYFFSLHIQTFYWRLFVVEIALSIIALIKVIRA